MKNNQNKKKNADFGNIILTGDTHGNFKRIAEFCRRFETTPEDIMIILGDAGFNFWGGLRDRIQKEFVSQLPITVFCIHGNHEQRPEHIPSYQLTTWHGGEVWIEPEYPNIIFAKDGEIYDFNGLKMVVIGGAYSIDKPYRIAQGFGWWEDEQPSSEIKKRVEEQLKQENWKVDVVLSHTTPKKYEPTEMFLNGVDQSGVDKSTEEWLDTIEERLEYKAWYCGHYHTNKTIDKLNILFESYIMLNKEC